MVRIAIEVEAEDAHKAQAEFETALGKLGYVREEWSAHAALWELRAALQWASVDERRILDGFRAARINSSVEGSNG